MTLPGRNDPCPCGSGKKFKRCCVHRDPLEVKELAAKRKLAAEVAARESHQRQVEAWQAQVVVLQDQIKALKNFGQRVPIPGDVEARVRELIAREDFSHASPEEILAFIEPLVERAGDDERKLGTAVRTGILLWMVVTQRDADAREQALKQIQEKMQLTGEQQIIEFRIIAERMRRRHKFLFPEIWRERARTNAD